MDLFKKINVLIDFSKKEGHPYFHPSGTYACILLHRVSYSLVVVPFNFYCTPPTLRPRSISGRQGGLNLTRSHTLSVKKVSIDYS